MKDLVNLVPEAFFDFFSYLLPGMVFVLPLAFIVDFWSIFPGEEVGDVWGIIAYCLVSYIFGHLLTTVSELAISKPINYLFGNPSESLIGIGKGKVARFQVRLEPTLIRGIEKIVSCKFRAEIDQHTFFLCENYVRTARPDIGFLIRKRHAFEHLCRNLVVGSFVLILLLIVLMKDNTWPVLAILLPILAVSFIRYLDYRV